MAAFLPVYRIPGSQESSSYHNFLSASIIAGLRIEATPSQNTIMTMGLPKVYAAGPKKSQTARRLSI
jgi:hypothetical protein